MHLSGTVPIDNNMFSAACRGQQRSAVVFRVLMGSAMVCRGLLGFFTVLLGSALVCRGLQRFVGFC